MAFLRLRYVSRLSSYLRRNVSTDTKEPKLGRMQRIGRYFGSILADYRVVLEEAVQDMRQRPVRSAVLLGAAASVGYVGHHNPSGAEFESCMVEASNELLMLSDAIRSPAADSHLRRLIEAQNAGCLRRLNLGVCSLMWCDNYDAGVDVYAARCRAIGVRWRDIPSRVVDVGVLGRWLWLERAMVDYDINPDEWRTSDDAVQSPP